MLTVQAYRYGVKLNWVKCQHNKSNFKDYFSHFVCMYNIEEEGQKMECVFVCMYNVEEGQEMECVFVYV